MLLVLASVAIVSAGVTSLISYLTARQAIEHQQHAYADRQSG